MAATTVERCLDVTACGHHDSRPAGDVSERDTGAAVERVGFGAAVAGAGGDQIVPHGHHLFTGLEHETDGDGELFAVFIEDTRS